MQNRDTNKVERVYGDMWFGITAGPNLNLYFGKYKLPEHTDPALINVPTNLKHLYNLGGGAGLFGGLVFEYLPINKYWGGGLGVRLIDYNYFSSSTPIQNDALHTRFENTLSINYISLSPYARYNLPITGLHAFAGLDVDFCSDYSSKQRNVFVNTGTINWDRIVKYSSLKTRWGGQLGIGWDIFAADVYGKARARITPYFSMHMGSNILTDFGSSLNNVVFRFGLQLKVARDRVEYDTLMFDPDFETSIRYIASAQNSVGIQFEGFRSEQELPTVEMRFVPAPVIKNELKIQPVITEVEKPKQKPATEQYSGKLRPNALKTFSFKSSTTTELDGRTKQYLDDVADFLKNNPGFQVRVVGHSDNQGTIIQNQERARARAMNVQKYLRKKGVPNGSILVTEQGSLKPLVTNTTEAGRRQNRRVEITIVR